jgi:hypothetical protein
MNKKTLTPETTVFADFEKLSKKRKKEELEATREVIKDRDFLKSIMSGDEDFTMGRFKSWSEVKENV